MLLLLPLPLCLTLLATLGVGLLFGQTINRITLFAIILALGLLVDDSIVVVENIHRHLSMPSCPRRAACVGAVNEISSPTIYATLAVMVSMVPMAFVTGMMGPYMGTYSLQCSCFNVHFSPGSISDYALSGYEMAEDSFPYRK